MPLEWNGEAGVFVGLDRFLARLEKTTNRPSGVKMGEVESPPPPAGGGCDDLLDGVATNAPDPSGVEATSNAAADSATHLMPSPFMIQLSPDSFKFQAI